MSHSSGQSWPEVDALVDGDAVTVTLTSGEVLRGVVRHEPVAGAPGEVWLGETRIRQLNGWVAVGIASVRRLFVVTAPGLYEMDDDEYHADPLRLLGLESLSVSWSRKLLSPGSPARYRWDRDHPRESSAAFDLGHAAHALVLGVGAPLREVIADSWRTKAAQDARQAARAAGETPLLSAEMRQVEDMATALAEHPRVADLLAGGAPEMSAFAEVGGVWLRARFDYLRGDGITDYKTTVCAHPDRFVRSAVDYGYHCQSAWYSDTAAALDLGDLPLTFVAQEKEPPYLVAVCDLPADMIAAGRARNAAAVDLFARCWESGEWPGYPTETVTLTTPSWLRTPTLAPGIEAEYAALLKEIA